MKQAKASCYSCRSELQRALGPWRAPAIWGRSFAEICRQQCIILQGVTVLQSELGLPETDMFVPARMLISKPAWFPAGCLALLRKVMALSPQIIAVPAIAWEVTWPYCSGEK